MESKDNAPAWATSKHITSGSKSFVPDLMILGSREDLEIN
jgi:hypothetical protein